MHRFLVPRRLSVGLAFLVFAGFLSSCWSCGQRSSSNSPAGQHSVDLHWIASTSPVSGYKVYRGSQHLGPYSPMNTTPTVNTNYTDSNVQSGATYYYVVTSVDAHSHESTYSNEVQVTVPSP
ncbi:MAG TPA: hypothetical protein VN708_00740 [Terriglobales bacterium]|jgi:fibronectin type 3 domain-containing protein|nr:hypothetical protein [Terriglobales bacterium]